MQQQLPMIRSPMAACNLPTPDQSKPTTLRCGTRFCQLKPRRLDYSKVEVMPLLVFSWVDMAHHIDPVLCMTCALAAGTFTVCDAYGWLRLPAISGWSNRTFVMGRKAEDAS